MPRWYNQIQFSNALDGLIKWSVRSHRQKDTIQDDSRLDGEVISEDEEERRMFEIEEKLKELTVSILFRSLDLSLVKEMREPAL